MAKGQLKSLGKKLKGVIKSQIKWALNEHRKDYILTLKGCKTNWYQLNNPAKTIKDVWC